MLGAIQGLQEREIISTVILPENGDIEEELQKLRVRYVIIDSKILRNTSKFKRFITLVKYVYYLSLFKSDIFHSNDIFCNKYMARAGKILKKTTVCHVRFSVDELQIKYYMNPQPDHIIFNSKFMEKEFWATCPNYKFMGETSVVYNPIPETNYYKPQFREVIRSKWGSFDRYIICIVGNISKNKGHLDFVEIAKKLSVIRKDFLFVVVGQDISSDKSHLKAVLDCIDKCGLKEHFIFHGVDSDMGKIFSGIDLLLFPSHFESFGRVAVESLLARVPVVASRVGGLIEILDENPAARLVDVGDVDGFVSAVLDLRSSTMSNNLKLISDGKSKIEEKFCFEKSVGDLLLTYKKKKRI